MNSPYKFKWRRWFFWKRVTVIGHSYAADQNKMVLFLPGGAVREIKNWTRCEVKLGVDWVAATKEKMSKEAGTQVPLNV